MTINEKLKHFYEVSMETAREEAGKAITQYRETLDKEAESHKAEKLEASRLQFKIQSENAAREINKALSAEHLHIKREISRKQQELKEKLFSQVHQMLTDFTKTEAYKEWLTAKIKESLEVAGEDEVQIYLTPSDSALTGDLEKTSGVPLLISETPFLGGIKAVIPKKNILIDNTLLTLFETEKENFNFNGGLMK